VRAERFPAVSKTGGTMFGRRSKKNEVIETNIIFRNWEEPEDPEELKEQENLAGEDVPSGHSAISTSRGVVDPQAEVTLRDVLKTYGRFAFDLEDVEAVQVQERCYDLAEQLRGRTSSFSSFPSTGDWTGIRGFFSGHRRREQTYVQNTLKDFRGVLWEFIEQLGQTVSEDKAQNTAISDRLVSLRASVQTGNPRELKQQVLEVVQFIGKAIEQREQRQQAQMRQVGKRLKNLRAELVNVRKKMALDPLTQLYNRSALDEHLKRVAQLFSLSGEYACLYMLDADHFKQINDTYGHPVGDTVLKTLAGICIRSFPRKTDFIARYGGEEFVVIVEGAPRETCLELGQRLLDTIGSRTLSVDEREIKVTISIGMAMLDSGETSEQWLERADHALRTAKKKGRNCIVAD
jgi:diguanylate cyclase (GGDEF)-like protein